MTTQRPICLMEKGYLTSGQCYIQLAIKVKESKLIETYTKKFFAMCTPFHLRQI